MKMGVLTGIVFVSHLFFGILCMQTVAAQEIPAAPGEAMEMIMSPMTPMSPVHCEYCVHIVPKTDAPLSSGCAGMCVAKTHDALAAVLFGPSSQYLSAVLPQPFFVLVEHTSSKDRYIASTAPPPYFEPGVSMVMLL